MRFSHFVLVVAVVLAGCSRPTVITITNQSVNRLRNVVVSGSGFINRIDSIEPGTERKLSAHTKGESGLRLEFDAADKRIDSGEQGYFETSYKVTATIETNLIVSVASQL